MATPRRAGSRACARDADKPAIIAPDATLSYRDAFQRAQHPRALTALGLRKGDVIAIQLPNVPEFMLAYFAANMMGAVLAPMHMPYRAREMAPLLHHARARLVICGAPVGEHVPADMFLALRNEVETLAHVVTIGPARPATPSLQQLIEGGPFEDIRNPGVAADPAILCFTSGTSSAPKAVVHNAYTMLANNRLCGPPYALSASDVLLSGAPFTHAFGICIINFALSVGATQLPARIPAGPSGADHCARPANASVRSACAHRRVPQGGAHRAGRPLIPAPCHDLRVHLPAPTRPGPAAADAQRQGDADVGDDRAVHGAQHAAR
jgi:cyclohexanecarboxylate-CoA ligase